MTSFFHFREADERAQNESQVLEISQIALELIITERKKFGAVLRMMLTQQTSLHELLLEGRFDGGEFLSCFVLLHRILAALLGERIFLAFGQLELLAVLLTSQRKQVVVFVELFEGCCIDGDDAVLHQGLGTNQLVVRGVVNNIEDASLACGSLRSPSEVAGFQAESTKLAVSTTGSHKVDALASDLKQICKCLRLEICNRVWNSACSRNQFCDESHLCVGCRAA